MWTIYTMWNGQNVTLMLQAVAATFSDTSFTGLLRAGSIIAFMAVLLAVATRGRMDGLWQWIFGFFIMVTLGVTVKTNVNVVDYRFNYAQQVQDVPFVLAIGYGEISHFGYWITQKYETNFTPPGSVTFENYGMVFGAQMAATLTSLKASDPIVNDNIISITQTCLAPEFIQNPLSIKTVVQSTNLAADVPQILNPGRLADVTDENGFSDVMPCDQAWQTAMQQYDSSSASLYSFAVAKMFPGQTTIGRLQNNPSVVSSLASNIPTVADQMLINSSQSTASLIKQAALANAIRSAGSKLQSNVAQINEQLAGAMASSASDNTYAVMSQLAANVLPALHNVIELLVIGLFPLVMVMAFIAGPMILGVMRMWLTAAGWIQFWGPLYALVNGIMSSQSNIPSIVSAINGNGNPGMSMQNMGTVFGQAMSEQQLASMICLSVPLLSYAIVRGGEMVMTSLASGVISPAQSAASRAGDEVGHGNMQMGQVSWGNVNTNNTNSNQMRTSASVDTGTTSLKGGDAMQYTIGNPGAGMSFGAGGGGGGMSWGGGGSQVLGVNASALSDNGGPLSGKISGAVSEQLSQDAGMSWQKADQAAARQASSVMKAWGNSQSSGWSTGTTYGGNDSWSTGSDASDQTSFGNAMASAEKFAKSANMSTQDFLRMAMGVKAGISTPGKGILPVSAGASASAEGGQVHTTTAQESAAREFSNSNDFKTIQGFIERAGHTSTGTTGTTGGVTASGSVMSELRNAYTASKDLGESVQKAQQYSEAARSVQQGGAGFETNILNALRHEPGGLARLESDIKKANMGDASGAADVAHYAAEYLKSGRGQAILDAVGAGGVPSRVAGGAAIRGGVESAVSGAPSVGGGAGARPAFATPAAGPQPAMAPDARHVGGGGMTPGQLPNAEAMPQLAAARAASTDRALDSMSRRLEIQGGVEDGQANLSAGKQAAHQAAGNVRTHVKNADVFTPVTQDATPGAGRPDAGKLQYPKGVSGGGGGEASNDGGKNSDYPKGMH
ncbi:hypothetical protein VI03_25250 [Burkholderia vietnamiensis]|uniref:conjugal transfer protein TraG N-terminal domain-containing protein n=1 Tax=Burkholderia vietnamiensis TaxID=60552 RepID=UPI0006225143|nr:conjugal transfer protein TraG N-terminal domain-containing protein [Burkholderia vietnamiensis]KKI36087.1 hypothetical protein VI03_25250 [Burkholderia vietnamiensis]MBR8189153.1 conjugal transfer protein TraG N-terminal domain-containing protein [Burkholderia vietnamiensis]HDR9174360.1 conjugal transfer protein TraG N-terminal domain-containing protein [Burkholderia vietnamiensis]